MYVCYIWFAIYHQYTPVMLASTMKTYGSVMGNGMAMIQIIDLFPESKIHGTSSSDFWTIRWFLGTVQDINAVYKKMALELHPDKGGDPEKFQELQEMKAAGGFRFFFGWDFAEG